MRELGRIQYSFSGCVQFDDTVDGIFWTEYQSEDAKYANDNILEDNPIAWTKTTIPVGYKFDGNLIEQTIERGKENEREKKNKSKNNISISFTFNVLCAC